MPAKTLIGMVDDKAINRSTFTQKLAAYDDVELSLVAVNGNDFLEQLKGLPVDKVPSVVFMDLEMPEMDGVQTITMARSMYPEIFFIVLTVFDDDDKLFEAIRAGAHGYLLKDENAAVLHSAINSVKEHGGAPMSPAIARKALSMLSKTSRSSAPEETEMIDELLTEREKEILLHTINGYDAKRMASILDISVLTIRKHIANIYQKLHVNSRAQVISLAHKRKWV